MCIIRHAFLRHTDPDASVAFYGDTVGVEVGKDVGTGQMRWITISPAGQPGTSIILHPQAPDPGITCKPASVKLLARKYVRAITGNTTTKEEITMSLTISAILLGVSDINRAKEFYSDGLGCKIEEDHGGYVELSLDDGPKFALYPRAALAKDAGVDADGSGFTGVTFHYFTPSAELVDDVLAQAESAGGTITNPAQEAKWGGGGTRGYFGYFSDPDGNLWKVVSTA